MKPADSASAGANPGACSDSSSDESSGMNLRVPSSACQTASMAAASRAGKRLVSEVAPDDDDAVESKRKAKKMPSLQHDGHLKPKAPASNGEETQE
jgi:hypothetical protein